MEKRIWVWRVAVFEYIFSCLINVEQDPIVIVNNFNLFDGINEWQKKIINDYANNFLKYQNLIKNNLKTKWTYEQIDNIVKAVIFETIAEQNAHKTEKKILIDQALKTVQRYGEPYLKKITNAILDKILK